MNNKCLIFAIDFDGTIVNHEFPKIGQIKDNSKNVINRLYKKGHKIIIWTCRSLDYELKEVNDFLNEKGFCFNTINKNIEGIRFNPYPKVYADIYIDDRNIFCKSIDWHNIEIYLIKLGIL